LRKLPSNTASSRIRPTPICAVNPKKHLPKLYKLRTALYTPTASTNPRTDTEFALNQRFIEAAASGFLEKPHRADLQIGRVTVVAGPGSQTRL
jgi:hypothetical protein